MMYTHGALHMYMVTSIKTVKEKINEKPWKEATIESVSVCKKICVGARLCKVSRWRVCCFCVGAASYIRRRYRTELEVVVGTGVCVCVCG